MQFEPGDRRRVLPRHLRPTAAPEVFAYSIRPARSADLPHVREIYNHFVSNSVVTLDDRRSSIPSWREKFALLSKLQLPFLVAVFLSNVPEGVSATVGMKGHRSTTYILGLWSAVAVASALAAMVGHAVLGGAGDTTHAVVQAFAAGAILTMLTDTMVPEATKHADKVAGLVSALGFTCAFLLSRA